MSCKDKMDLLARRIEALESKVYDDKKDESVKIVDSLLALQNKLQSLVTGREKLTSMFAKLDEMEKYLDPEYIYADNLMLTDGATKMHLILSEEDKIREAVDSLQTVKDLEHYVNSEHLKATPTLIHKLQKLNKEQLELVGGVGAFDEKTKKLLDEYNTLIESISQQFVLWDSRLTQLEEERDAGSNLSP